MSSSTATLSGDASCAVSSQDLDSSVPRTPVASRSREILSPVVVSPSESCISSDDDHHDDDVFDDPVPASVDYLTAQPKGKSSTPSTLTPVTPLTPPLIKSKRLVDAESPLSRKWRPAPNEEKRVQIDQDEEFKPQKLIKQMTDKMNELTESLKVFGKLSLDVKYDFSPSQIRRPATLRRSGPTIQTNESTNPSTHLHRSEPTVPTDTSQDSFQPSRGASPTTIETRKPTTTFGKDLEYVVPVTICQRLASSQTQCVASLQASDKAGTQCESRRKVKSDDWKTAMAAIVSCYEGYDMASLVFQLEKLIQCTMCGTHQKSGLSNKRLGSVGTWINTSPERKTARKATKRQEEQKDFEAWLKSITGQVQLNPEVVEQESQPFLEKKVASTDSKPNQQPSPHRNISYSFQPYQSQALKKLSVSEALRKQVEKPLTKLDQKPGYIYIFWHKGKFGYVKIGRTRDPEERLEQWNRNCKREHEYHASGAGLKVPYVARVERLIQIELKEKRRWMSCDECKNTKGQPKKHIEWFEVSDKEAAAVLEKWRAWIVKDPYGPVAGIDGWELKPEFGETLDDVCRPIQTEAKTRPTSSHRRKSSGRYSLRKTAARRSY
ncbi:DUF1766-domain-containing protein [Lophiostoma macrostomum CBS 122681]|uniref:DUF1766-domain-containing protein n=1 Tax=Lophiostoma macrostomum CBS 122681 TaxID=1314788 RepID=A0A6A6SMD9_9PLEO|nr:DUF1766-domain-containing protein [Lophiostoma macrostomum CBS 122681]